MLQPRPSDPALPPWTWSELQALLVSMAATPSHQAMVEHLVEGIRLQQAFLTPAGLLRELAVVTVALMDPCSRTRASAP